MLQRNTTTTASPLQFEFEPKSNYQVHFTFVIVAFINSISAIIATSGNMSILITLWRTPSLHSPANALLFGLALSDLGVGLLVQPFFVISKVAQIEESRCWISLWLAGQATTYLLTTVSFLTLACMSLERLLTLKLHLRYHEVVNIRRTLVVLTFIWAAGLFLQITRFISKIISFYLTIFGLIIFLLIALWSYYKIFQIVRHHHSKIRVHPAQEQLITNVTRYRKSIITLTYVVGVFVLCYLPFGCVMVVNVTQGTNVGLYLADHYVTTLVWMNSSFNPLIYSWRMNEFRRALKNTISSVCCITS